VTTPQCALDRISAVCAEARVSLRWPVGTRYRFLRRTLAVELGKAMRTFDPVVLIDDSQMFGGVLARNYDAFPDHLRVFGDHSGFVGAGAAHAVGYALADPRVSVWCTLGDYAFLNGARALYAAAEQRARVIFVVGNNGGSVSLETQLGDGPAFLGNPPGVDYCGMARAIGIEAARVDGRTRSHADCAVAFRDALARANNGPKPFLIELLLPSAGEAWDGIWANSGLDDLRAR
jgi:acetolactate synthase-1/2/3 large subunit